MPSRSLLALWSCTASFVLPLACIEGPEPPVGASEATGPATSADESTGTGGPADDSGSTSSATGSGEASTESGDTSSSSAGETTAGDDGPAPTLPAELLELTAWKLTLPTGRDEQPHEVLQPELATFEQAPQFWLDGEIPAVVFRAEAGGVTTSGSSYPRSELREMTADGEDEASWSTSEGRHVMTIRQAITALPPGKPHVVAGQIHDAEDDLVMIRLEGEHLFVEGGGDELGDLDPAYALGTVFTVQIVADSGTIDVYYDDLETPAVTVLRDAEGCYFKAGAYTQSNLDYDEADAYGEVAIYELEVEHP